MIDRVAELDADRGTIRAIARLPEVSPVFQGHFPGFPTLPGVMMLEMSNHAAGYILIYRTNAAKFVFLGGVKRAKFRRFVRPGNTGVIEARIIHDGSGYAVAQGSLRIDDELAAEAEITAAPAGKGLERRQGNGGVSRFRYRTRKTPPFS